MTENSAYIQYLRTQFEAIRDERRTSANTATRIGTAFLDLLGLVELHDDTPWETVSDPEAGTKSAHLRAGYDGAWTEGYLSALGRNSDDNEGSALLFDPLASINEANLGMPMEAGVGIVWNGLRWEYGKTGGGGFSSITQDGLSLTFSGDGIQNQTVNLNHTHNVSDLTNDLGFVTSSTLDGLLAAKVDVSWFSRLFKAYNGSTEVAPNQNATIDNIRAMFGFWTEQYLSALGRGSTANSMLDESMMWALLGSNGNQQIDLSHLQSALGTYMPQGVLVSVAKNSAYDGMINFVGTGTGNVYTVDFNHTHAFDTITGTPTTLAGYGITDTYTISQVDGLLAGKVDVSWFRRLFRAYNGSTEVAPNQSATIDNIQAMFGFWTNQYLSALGRGSTGGTLLDEAVMWSLLANGDSTYQISISHLTTALSSYAQMNNAITSVTKGSADGKINFVTGTNGTYTVDFNHTHQWAQITGQPTSLSQFQNDVPFATVSDMTSAISVLQTYNTVTKVSEGILRWSGQNTQTDVNLIHTHAFDTITGKPTTLAGYGITDAYTISQVDGLLAGKVDVSWFRRLFRAYNGSTEVAPNQSATIDNIQAMFGFWTNQYLSALGRGNTSGTMIDETMMWSLLANGDATHQISISHLTTALSSYVQTSNAITSVAKGSADGKINFITGTNGTYTVDFNHTHAFDTITGKPTTLAGYGITDAAAKNHSHDVYLGTTRMNTSYASGMVTGITGLGSINTNALVLRQITYNSATVNAVGIGTAPSYPLDVAQRARFLGGLYLYDSSATASLTIEANKLYFSGSGYSDHYIRKGSNYIAISSSSSGENGIVVYSSNEVRFTAGAWSDSYLSALGQNTSSDKRLKTELGPVSLKVDDIAAAPMVRYRWAEKPWLGEQAGSYAQYWKDYLPETVKTGRDGYLEMQYGVIALLSAIATARSVKDHERRIKELEEDNKQLKKEIEQLKKTT